MTDLARYYDQSYPPSVWATPATGATAGIPGDWTPAGSKPPASVEALAGGDPVVVTASPATAWTAGQYVQTRTAGAAGRATWSGTEWVGGVAPGELQAAGDQLDDGDTGDTGVVFDPADYTVAEVLDYMAAHPDDADRVVEAERAGRNRVGITGGD